MRILFVVYELGYGGQERQMSYAIRQLTLAKHKVSLVILSVNSANGNNVYGIRDMGVEIEYLKGSVLSKIFQLRSIIRNSLVKVDFVQSWSMPANPYVKIATLGLDSINIGAYRSNFSWRWKAASRVERFKMAVYCLVPTYIICNSKISKDALIFFRKKFGRKGGVLFLPNRLILPEAIEKRIRKGAVRSLSVGSLLSYKRWDFLIRLIAELNSRGLHIVHRHAGLNGPMKNELDKLVDELGIKNNFRFIGQIDKIGGEYRNAELLIHTSEVEGTANAVLEAMSYGLPVFTSNCGDVSLYVDETNGSVIQNYDLDEWCDKIMMDIAKNCLHDLGKNSRFKAEKLLGVEFLLNDLDGLYRKLK